MHRSVTTKILLVDMFLQCDTKNIGNIRNLTDIIFVRQDAKKKGPRSKIALDRRWFFQVAEELQRMPIDNSASI